MGEDDETGHYHVEAALVVKYCLIPVFAAVIGYLTNVVALKMTFYPLEYIGFGEKYFVKYGLGPWHLGWQGIVPSKAAKMARKAIVLLTSELIDIKEVFGRVQPHLVAEALDPVLDKVLSAIVKDVAMVYAPDLWTSLPLYVRAEIVARVREDTPRVIEAVMADIRANIDAVIDLEQMVVTHLVADKELLNSVFMRAGAKELRFIERSGLYFGFLLGIVQAAVFVFVDSWFVLPIAGFLSGYLTNWLALKMIFEPVEKTPCCCNAFELHGLFLSHQAEVSEAFGTAVAREIMTSGQILRQLFLSPSSEKAIQIVHYHISHAMDQSGQSLGPVLPLVLGGEQFEEMKKKVAARRALHARKRAVP